jgi:hypothetical protein
MHVCKSKFFYPLQRMGICAIVANNKAKGFPSSVQTFYRFTPEFDEQLPTIAIRK